jgi:subtilase family serine protease
MPRPDRLKLRHRRRSDLKVESLESRQLLNATPVTNLNAFPIRIISEPMHIAGAEKHTAAHIAGAEKHAAAHPIHATALKHTPGMAIHKAHQDLTRKDIHPSRNVRVKGKGGVAALVHSNDSPALGAYNPTQVRTAYGINLLPNQGQGVTVAIVDVFVDPNIQGDVNTFSTQYGLPKMDGVGSDPKLTIVTQPGTPNSPVNGGPQDTSTETALDVEWVHAIAPLANIVLVFAKDFSYEDADGLGLLPAVQTGTATPGVVATSVSYGGGEFSTETTLESFFTTPTGANPSPVAIDFSTGDGGFPSFPAVSPSVLAVGGTSLFLQSARGAYGFETAWGDVNNDGAGGGGLSAFYGSPGFQSNNGVKLSSRGIPDVSAIADPITGVSVFNSYDHSVFGTSWLEIGGTSLATPVVSGMIALAQQNRINSGLLPLSSPQINAKLYATYNSANYSKYFHDITIGNNNGGQAGGFFTAVTGYDLATGIGSPKGNMFVSLLSAP